MSTDDDIRELQRSLEPGIDPRTTVREVVPLQEPGRDEIVRVIEFPHPDNPSVSGRDRRLVIDLPTLDQVAEIAKHSLTKRAVWHGVGIRVETRRDRNGHLYEVWKLTAAEVVPEHSLADDLMAGSDGNRIKGHK